MMLNLRENLWFTGSLASEFFSGMLGGKTELDVRLLPLNACAEVYLCGRRRVGSV